MTRIHATGLLPALLCAGGFLFAGCGKEAPPAPTPTPESSQQIQEETSSQPVETTTTTHKPSTYHDPIAPS